MGKHLETAPAPCSVAGGYPPVGELLVSRGGRVHGALVDQGHEFDQMDRAKRRARPAAAERTLAFSPDVDLPLRIVTGRVACLGISGSGKTYGAGRLAELLLDAGAQVVILDNVGNWYGLRVDADGRGAGIAIPILGGEHGDVPLGPHDGRTVAEVIAETRASMIVDVSDLTTAELQIFARDLATHLLRAKKRQTSPMMMIWEEVHEIVPQRVLGKEQAKTVAAVERLVKRGRNYGVGSLLISQRTAAVNKDVLNMVGTVLAFRTGGPQDRAALKDWMTAAEVDEDHRRALDDLPGLPTGTCFLWSPHELGRDGGRAFARIRVSKKRTFDASRTPDLDEEIVAAGALAPVDLARFGKKLSAAIERAHEHDPEVLHRRIAQLERELKTATTALAAEIAEASRATKVREVPVPTLDIKTIEMMYAHVTKLEDDAKQVIAQGAAMRRTLSEAKAGAPATPPKRTPREDPMEAFGDPATAHATPKPAKPKTVHVAGKDVFSSPFKLEPAHQKILTAVAWFWQVLGVGDPALVAVSRITGYAARGGRFRNLCGSLRSAGFLDYPAKGLLALTDMGWNAVKPAPPRARTALEVQNAVRAELEPAAIKILDELIGRYPHPVTVAALAQGTGYEAGGGRFRNLCGHLRSLYLVTSPERGGNLRAADRLFPTDR